jgi:hypothetical protein
MYTANVLVWKTILFGACMIVLWSSPDNIRGLMVWPWCGFGLLSLPPPCLLLVDIEHKG